MKKIIHNSKMISLIAAMKCLKYFKSIHRIKTVQFGQWLSGELWFWRKISNLLRKIEKPHFRRKLKKDFKASRCHVQRSCCNKCTVSIEIISTSGNEFMSTNLFHNLWPKNSVNTKNHTHWKSRNEILSIRIAICG